MAKSPWIVGALAAGVLSASALADGPRAKAPRVEAALAELKAEAADLRVVWPSDRITPSLVAGISAIVAGEDAPAKAQAFLARFPALVAVPAAHLKLADVSTSGARSTVRYQQIFEGKAIEGRALSVTLEGDRVISVLNDTAPLSTVDRATIDGERARTLAVEAVYGAAAGAPSVEVATTAVPGIAAIGGRGVEIFKVFVFRKALVEHLEVTVDAHLGRVIGVADKTIR
ncbi:MAG: hypothetical protein U1E65_04815 [Myxococcota bacterium]